MPQKARVPIGPGEDGRRLKDSIPRPPKGSKNYKDYIGVIMVYIGDLIFRSSQGSG